MMNHLQKITISNIRRFAENVEMEIGEGATIFLAPNGLGKTAIFEAIELALTGKVKRLIYPPEPLIKDNCVRSTIKLEFGEGIFCEAELKKGEEPIVSGNHQSLFGTVDAQDLPFLLQLTHFLNQRGDNWFVQANGEVAGSQLDHLSIGREAAEVNKKIPSAKKAANALLEQAQIKFDTANERLQSWLALIEKRSGANPLISDTMVSKSTLLVRINQVIIQIKDAKLVTNENLLYLKIQLSEVQAMALSILENFNKTAISYEGLDVVIPDYILAQSSLIEIRNQLDFSKSNKGIATSNIEKCKTDINNQLSFIVQKEAEIRKQQEIKFEVDNLTKVKRDIKTINDSLPNLQETIRNKTLILNSATTKYDNANKANTLIDNFEKKERLSNQKTDLVKKYTASLNKWFSNNDQILYLTGEVLPPILINYSEQQGYFARLNAQQTKQEKQIESLQEAFNSLNSASDNIKEAIGVIISGYPSDRGDCPVCGEVYTPNELHRRMENALISIDPNLKLAAENLEIAKVDLNKLQIEIEKSKRELEAAATDLNRINEQILNLESVGDQIWSEIENCKNPKDATAIIGRLNQELLIEAADLRNERDHLEQRLSPQQLFDLAAQQISANNDLIKSIERLNIANENIIGLVERKNALEAVVNTFGNISGINEILTRLETELNSAKNLLETLRKALNNYQLTLDSLNDQISRLEINLSQATTRLSNLRGLWTQAKLTGDPSEQILSQAKANLKNRIERWEQNISELENLNSEMAKWQAFEDNEKIDDEINLLRGDLEEAAFQNQLTSDLEKSQLVLLDIAAKIQALNAFGSSLETELLTVHERIRTINPLWKKLLKRIVIDPRFAETTLDNFNYYKKQHANVLVPVNGNDTLVSQVASEAQLTDIQLTFLLAMAEKYQWSPWKALLLDDPTQHHDLVHASAVFDLLRDYISEYGFQVLMATHDAVQARFLLRKLKNDGITAKLYTLFAADGGVKVRLSS